ncbi:MAG TPA: hypothetical protein VFP59_13985 [Candidatus Angelobacter sp.]|nr:hypothetical protein [Candidatus Angelobacter sp.]
MTAYGRAERVNANWLPANSRPGSTRRDVLLVFLECAQEKMIGVYAVTNVAFYDK